MTSRTRGGTQGGPEKSRGRNPSTRTRVGGLPAPGFSTGYMDRSVPPETDFYRFAVGSWIRRNPIPADKVYWGAFSELSEYNYKRLRGLLERAAGRKRTARYSVEREVGDFYRAAVDAHRRNRLRFRPIARELAQIDKVCSMEGLVQVVAEFHNQGVPLLFETRVYPDKKNSGIYAFYLQQAGLSLPDRDYYLTPGFARQRRAFRRHLVRMLSLLGAPAAEARRDAGVILRIEAELAKASRSRVELRDEEKNYHKFRLPRLRALAPTISWDHYLSKRGATRLSYVIVGQPEFFEAVGQLLGRRPLAAWKAYLRWHLLRARAGYLHRPVAREVLRFLSSDPPGSKSTGASMETGRSSYRPRDRRCPRQDVRQRVLPPGCGGPDAATRHRPSSCLPQPPSEPGLDDPGHPTTGPR